MKPSLVKSSVSELQTLGGVDAITNLAHFDQPMQHSQQRRPRMRGCRRCKPFGVNSTDIWVLEAAQGREELFFPLHVCFERPLRVKETNKVLKNCAKLPSGDILQNSVRNVITCALQPVDRILAHFLLKGAIANISRILQRRGLATGGSSTLRAPLPHRSTSYATVNHTDRYQLTCSQCALMVMAYELVQWGTAKARLACAHQKGVDVLSTQSRVPLHSTRNGRWEYGSP